MRYPNSCRGVFCSRPNRFVAEVELEGVPETVHVKNTGRCKELLLPGAAVILTEPGGPARKTRYDLIAVEREGRLINIDSQAPNKAAAEYLRRRYPDAGRIQPEVRRGDSRLDFLIITKEEKRIYTEVKGVTLFEGDTALFPDAPTQRGVKHLKELISCVEAGEQACLLFVIQAKGARRFRPNDAMDPAFGQALRQAAARGVCIEAVDCLVGEDFMLADAPVGVGW